MTTPFAEVSRRSQLYRLGQAADLALERYGLGDYTRKLVVFDFNATYRIDCAAGRFALRINVNSPHSGDAVRAEATWVDALGADGRLCVPAPAHTTDGSVSTTVPVAGLDHEVGTVLYSWLAGPDLGERASATRLHGLGRAMAMLHDHSESWTHPDTAARPNVAAIFMDEDDAITGDPRLKKTDATVIAKAIAEMERILDPVFAGPSQLLHADLHVWNTKWVDGDIAVIDFDDAGFGVPIQDLAISSFYVRDRAGAEDAIRAGYETVRPLPPHTDETFEALVASRSVMLLNSIMPSLNADTIAFVPEYAERTGRRMRTWLDTGRYEA